MSKRSSIHNTIIALVSSLILGACSTVLADRPEITELEIASRTLRPIFPVEDESTFTPTATLKLIFPVEPTDTPTPTPIGYDPSPTATLIPIFPLEPSDTPAYCRSDSNIAINISGVIWLDKDGDGVRDAEDVGLRGVVVDVRGGGIGGVPMDIGHSESAVRTGEDGSYQLPVRADEWPVIVLLPNRFYAFKSGALDDNVVYITREVIALCAGSSYDVGLVPLLEDLRPVETKRPGEEQEDNNDPPPSCAQQPNNPYCVP